MDRIFGMKENPVYPVSHFMANTIVALATPTGRSGIGVVRLSGAQAIEIAAKVADQDLEPRHATLVRLVDPANGEVIDEAVATFFKAPRSFTGEDVVEVSCHGSPVLLRQLIDICLSLGARMADPGEFTLRALANGKIDLAEAEAIRDLIDAQTTAGARQAVRQMRGEFSHRLQPIRDELLDVIVVLESALEFVEDDLPETQNVSIMAKLEMVAADIEKIADTFQAGRLIREGLRIALVGRPNVGKSSLFNALLGSDRAIVTEIPGTTRDQIHERFTVRDIPISLVDTAGLRETQDAVEVIGVERSRRAMVDADLILVVLDASEDLSPEDLKILESIDELTHLLVINKIDKVRDEDLEAFRSKIQGPISKSVSAKTGQGLDELKGAIVNPFKSENVSSNGFLVTDARHFDLLVRAQAEVKNSIALLDQRKSEEIVLVGLHNALRYLGQITGETTTEDMLTRIFSTFCIGK
jgi:tRNA modification GTPase